MKEPIKVKGPLQGDLRVRVTIKPGTPVPTEYTPATGEFVLTVPGDGVVNAEITTKGGGEDGA